MIPVGEKADPGSHAKNNGNTFWKVCGNPDETLNEKHHIEKKRLEDLHESDRTNQM